MLPINAETRVGCLEKNKSESVVTIAYFLHVHVSTSISTFAVLKGTGAKMQNFYLV